MMKIVVLIPIAVYVSCVVAEDTKGLAAAIATAAQRTIYETGNRVTRQDLSCSTERFNELLLDIPPDCNAAAEELDLAALARFDPDEIEKVGDILCEPSCGNPVLAFYRECLAELGQALNSFYQQFCAVNDRGDRCHSANVAFYIQSGIFSCASINSGVTSTCTLDCQNALQTATANIGCCVNVIVRHGGIVDTSDRLERVCDVDLPDPCGGSTLSGGAGPTSSTSTSSNGAAAYTVATSTGVFVVLATTCSQSY